MATHKPQLPEDGRTVQIGAYVRGPSGRLSKPGGVYTCKWFPGRGAHCVQFWFPDIGSPVYWDYDAGVWIIDAAVLIPWDEVPA